MTKPSDDDMGRAFYLAMYEKDGAKWEANEHKDIWIAKAKRYCELLPSDHSDYITVALLGSGYAAIHMRWYADMNDYDVQQTGHGRYKGEKAAVIEAHSWSLSDDIELRL